MEEGHAMIVAGTLAGFGALAWYVRSSAAIQAKAMDQLAAAIEKLRDRLDTIGAPSRAEHNQLAAQVNQIALRQVQIGTELEELRHSRREGDGG